MCIFSQNNDFVSLGLVYTVLSIIHGGSGMPVFAEPVYDYFITGKYQKVEIDARDIPDTVLKFIIEKVIEGSLALSSANTHQVTTMLHVNFLYFYMDECILVQL